MPGIKVFEHHVGKCFEHHVAPPISSKLNGSAARGTEVLIRGAGPCRGASTRFMVASGGVLSERYRHGGPGVCLGDGQTEAEGVPSQGGRGDALLRRMSPHLA